MKARNSKGEALVVLNVEQFGARVVRVLNGSRKVYEGKACDFAAKLGERYRFTCCADVRMADMPEIVF